MEFVEWKVIEEFNHAYICINDIGNEWYLHTADMWPMSADEKITYFLENALLPTK